VDGFPLKVALMNWLSISSIDVGSDKDVVSDKGSITKGLGPSSVTT